MSSEPRIQAYLMDMDGVLVREEQLVAGANDFVKQPRTRATRS